MERIYKPRPERWPQFTLRGMFVLVTILGVFFGWLGVQVKWIHERRAARIWIAEHQPPPQTSYKMFSRKLLPWVLRLFGEQPVLSISVAVAPGEKDEAERLQKLFPEADIDIAISD